MSEIIDYRERARLPVPQPRSWGPVSVRLAAPGSSDLAFIDELQKKHARMVGWMPTKQLETNIERGRVVVAESIEPQRHGDTERTKGSEQSAAAIPVSTNQSPFVSQCLRGSPPEANLLGYCIFNDKYFKREDVGIVYQLNVAPGSQRGLIGATLLREVFDRAAWGCKLFCCWCAQDLDANHFWQAMGFVPLAFRTGSERKARIHIFWQRRIRQGDAETPYWFPSETSGGALRENRLVIPIPPGTHWSEAKPLVLPGVEQFAELPPSEEESQEAEGEKPKRRRKKKAKAEPETPKFMTMRNGELITDPSDPRLSMPWYETEEQRIERERVEEEARQARLRPKWKKKAAKKQGKSKRTYHPEYLAAVRELCARYLDEVNREGNEHLLDGSSAGKYEVGRMLEHAPTVRPLGNGEDVAGENRLLDAA